MRQRREREEWQRARKNAYTVRVSRDRRALPTFEGDFPSYGAAEIHASRRADGARSSESFQVHRGTRHQPGQAIGPVFHSRSDQRTRRDFDRPALMKSIDADLRTAEKKKIADLGTRIRTAVRERNAGRASVTTYCQRERAAARERITMLRENLRREAASERLEARGRCSRERMAPNLAIAHLRAKLAEEKRFIADMRRMERGRRRGVTTIASARRAREKRGESDDEVRQNLPAELHPLFDRVRKTITAGPRKSRTEAFLEYVEAHPGEELEGIEERTDAMIREHEARQRRTGRAGRAGRD